MAAGALLLVANLVHLPVNAPGEPYHPIFSDWHWNGDLDGSFIEIFGGLQLLLAVVALLITWRARGDAVYAVWALVLATAAADDLLRGHERVRDLLMATVDLPVIPGLRPGDVGELVAWAIAVGILVPLLLLAHRRAGSAARHDSRTLAVLMAVLALFAVVFDMLHIVVETSIPPLAATGLSLVETAGELFVMTAIAVVASGMALHSARRQP
ncbi:hypothetical protein N866_05790 [Actinotalea ferrariae CF5-4]|uniref:DUF998 domain-containing protein n=1 Tax=Actinotalea ferrariae CF5-4 TaxID=948458 RepID=A0A021VNM6_9CELL|nr:hypothetical protein [Actinotalea ferrariae]EYR62708.1 hypothetical protein N866_05790 [Actinotalea ferrariae CF5-4]